MEDQVFALDIGTRKVAGLIMDRLPSGFNISEAVAMEQLPGAMQDGQIHNIGRVAQVIRRVTDQLAEASGTTLRRAAVAAAGRALITQKTKVSKKVGFTEDLTPTTVRYLELAAVQQAQAHISESKRKTSVDSYLCVGYTVVQYLLDGQPISSLAGHRGQTAEIEVIATFLPRIVVDSLIASLQEAGLEMASLTLEPIAAIHLVIPETLRMLNIALVDVGAGTSDIAICEKGTIQAYGMVPVAGDEITQGIANNFLLDFMVAENLKRQISVGSPLTCTDAFGNELELEPSQILEVIQPLVTDIASQITEQILHLNKTVPKGVILVGGGSLTLGLADELCSMLDLPQHLVKIRERKGLPIAGSEDFTGPQVVTPIGIGCGHLDGIAMEVQKVLLNDKSVQFLRLPGATIGDTLLHAGYSIRNLMGRPGRAITIEVNGRTVTVPGKMGTTAPITRNGDPATLDTLIHSDDTIHIEKPLDGEDAQVVVRDVIPKSDHRPGITLKVNGRSMFLPARSDLSVTVNGQEVEMDTEVTDGDTIEYTEPAADFILSDVFRIYDVQPPEKNQYLDIRINGRPVGFTHPLSDGDRVEFVHTTDPVGV